MRKKKKLLIAGGTGFIGFHLANTASKQGWEITSISTKKPSSKRKVKKVKYLICNINNKNKLKKISLLKFDYVVNLSGYVDHSNKLKTLKSHYFGCKNLAEVFINKSLLSFVQMGTSLEYGKSKSPHLENTKCRPISIYGKSKFYSTKHLLFLHKKYNFPSTILRLYQSYGEHQDFNRLIPHVIKNCLNKKKFPCSDGSQFRDFIHVIDVVNVIIKTLRTSKARGEIFNIGTGKATQVKKIIYKINEIIKNGSPQFGKIKLRKEENKKTYPNIKKAKKLLNWNPQINLDKGLLRTIKYYEKNFS